MVIAALGLAVWGGLIKPADPGRLEANDEQRIERLDRAIEAELRRRDGHPR